MLAGELMDSVHHPNMSHFSSSKVEVWAPNYGRKSEKKETDTCKDTFWACTDSKRRFKLL